MLNYQRVFHGKSYFRTSTHGPFMGYPLVNIYIANWKITMLLKGKSAISTGPFSIAMLVITRGYPMIFHDIYHQIPLSQIPIYFMGIPRSNMGKASKAISGGGIQLRRGPGGFMAGRDWDGGTGIVINAMDFWESLYIYNILLYIVYNNIYDNNIYTYIYT